MLLSLKYKIKFTDFFYLTYLFSDMCIKYLHKYNIWQDTNIEIHIVTIKPVLESRTNILKYFSIYKLF